MSTTVGELVEHLLKLPQDRKVWQAKDPEGNGFYEHDAPEEHYIEKGETYSTDSVFDEDDLLEDADPEERDEILASFEKVVVLWPR